MIRLLLLCLTFASIAGGFEIERVREMVNDIGSDAFEGRRSGHPGGDKTEQYLSARFQEYGLQAGGKGYFQEVPILATREVATALTLMNHELGKIVFVEGIDYTMVTHSGSGSFMGKVVIAGNGYLRPDKNRDDYGDLDCKGKIVVMHRGTPESPYSFGEDFSRGKTLAWAKEKGAAAILWHYSSFPLNGPAISKEDYDPNMPLYYIGDRILRLLLDGSGYTQKTYQEKLKTETVPLETDYTMWISARVKKLSTDVSRNVLGIVYGNDPVLKNEIIVVGGHMDHCGVNANGIIYNGADDNASGTAVVSELARSIAAGPPLKRSVLFIHFTAEEDGLIGSKYFVEHPTIPFGNIACMLNFDMVGQGNGVVGMAGGHLLGKPWYDYVEQLSVSELDRMQFYRADGHGGSDYSPFMRNGAPIVSFWTRGGHPFYHNYMDDSGFLVDSVLENVGDRGESLIRFIGNYDGPLASRSDSLKNLARFATTINLRGFYVDPLGTLPELSSINAAWLPHDSFMPIAEITARAAELHYVCKDRDQSSAGLKEAISAADEDRHAVFLAIPEAALVSRTPQQAMTLVRQGLSLVSLSPSVGNAGGKMPEPVEAILRDGGTFAEIPLDYTTPARIKDWGTQSIVTARLVDFAETPEEIRSALLESDALLFLEVEPDLTSEQLEAIRPAAQRRVHLSFGNAYPELRESEMKTAFTKLYANGFSRGEIILLTGGNLRRFLKS
jgi:hypothetical protein